MFGIHLAASCVCNDLCSKPRRKSAAIIWLRLGLAVAAMIAIVVAANGAHAATTELWVGDNSADWLTGGWTGGNDPPQSGDALVFAAAGASGATLNNDLAVDSIISGITFNFGTPAYVVGGNEITLNGGITVGASVSDIETINFNIVTSDVQTFTMQSGGGDLLIGGAISGDGGVKTAGAGTLTLSGNNSYTGTTTIADGTTLRVVTGGVLPASTSVSFSGAGILDVQNTSQTISNLSLSPGITAAVQGTGGSLTLNDGPFSITPIGSATTADTTLDLSALSNFVYNNAASSFTVNTNSNSALSAGFVTTLKLANVNQITASSVLFGGTGPTSGATPSSVVVTLGTTTTINANSFTIGSNRAPGTFQFATGLTNPTLTIRGSDGVSALDKPVDWRTQ